MATLRIINIMRFVFLIFTIWLDFAFSEVRLIQRRKELCRIQATEMKFLHKTTRDGICQEDIECRNINNAHRDVKFDCTFSNI